MRSRFGLIALVAVPLAVLTTGFSPRVQEVHAAREAGQSASSLDDQVELNVTVYNSDIALVRDVRNLDLPKGTFDLSFMDIAATVNPATVLFRSLSDPSRVNVLERPAEKGFEVTGHHEINLPLLRLAVLAALERPAGKAKA